MNTAGYGVFFVAVAVDGVGVGVVVSPLFVSAESSPRADVSSGTSKLDVCAPK